MELTDYKSDDNLRESGVWKDFDDARFLIRSTDSKAYRRVMVKNAQATGRRGAKSADKLHALSIKSLAEAILVDFTGISENGVPLENTLANREKILGFTEIREFVAGEAQDLTNYQTEADGAVAEEVKSGD